MVAHENSEEAQGLGSRFNRTVVEVAEGEVRIGAGVIGRLCGAINSVAECDSALAD